MIPTVLFLAAMLAFACRRWVIGAVLTVVSGLAVLS